MESIHLFSVSPASVDDLLTQAEGAHGTGHLAMATFDEIPTAMLFRPIRPFTGSLHYMFFPPRKAQVFHYHPGSRYLLVLGDVPLLIHHSPAATSSDPHQTEEVLVVPPCTLAAVRFPALYWHSFRTDSDVGRGVIAFPFHEDDAVADDAIVADGFMEEKTTFWRPAV